MGSLASLFSIMYQILEEGRVSLHHLVLTSVSQHPPTYHAWPIFMGQRLRESVCGTLPTSVWACLSKKRSRVQLERSKGKREEKNLCNLFQCPVLLQKSHDMNLSYTFSVAGGEQPNSDWRDPPVTPCHSLRAIKFPFTVQVIIYLGPEVINHICNQQNKQLQQQRKKNTSIFSNLPRFKKEQKVTGVFADWSDYVVQSF